ncbi:hypothetical protein DAPPUDRAFT_331751 [Daphnia pulex]|uniref:Uncharacterized protein n=1 Tax=Daphnia pulex TaxID=6669 RepID=E9HNC0_DAPPU|nr:hypothetical protein DAPPUDRAFT_331751 [Daphnia pulex]|eukprot:EFX66773.1 hypothetical protein DAPPUDRAFT_331751 [Daphnia pulex]
MVQLEKKIIELDAVNVEHGLRYTQLEEQVTQLEESVTLQFKNQNPQLQMEAGEDLASKVLQLEAKVPQQETLMVALNHILKLKEVVGEKMSELGEKDSTGDEDE